MVLSIYANGDEQMRQVQRKMCEEGTGREKGALVESC